MSRNIYNIYLCTVQSTIQVPPFPPNPSPPKEKAKKRKTYRLPSIRRLALDYSTPFHPHLTPSPLTLASKHPSRIKYPRIKQLMPPQPDIHSRNPLSGLLHPSPPPIPIRIHTPFLLLHTAPIDQPLQLLPQPHTPQ